MNIFTKIKAAWKMQNTAEKIGVVIDLISMIGGACAGSAVGDIAAGKAHTKIGYICAKITGAGVGLAVTELASKELRENYGDVLAHVIDKSRENEKKKEAA